MRHILIALHVYVLSQEYTMCPPRVIQSLPSIRHPELHNVLMIACDAISHSTVLL